MGLGRPERVCTSAASWLLTVGTKIPSESGAQWEETGQLLKGKCGSGGCEPPSRDWGVRILFSGAGDGPGEAS